MSLPGAAGTVSAGVIGSLPPLSRALFALCRREAEEHLGPDCLPELGTAKFADALAVLARRQGTLGLILVALERRGMLADLPDLISNRFCDMLRLLRRQAALWDLERNSLIARLQQEGLDPVLLKGAALRLTAYRDSVERPFGDLDILVAERAVDHAATALIAGGYEPQSAAHSALYRRHHHHLIFQKQMGFRVELHWALQPPNSPFVIDAAAFRNQAGRVALPQGPTTLVPAPPHMVLHLALQNLEDGFSRLGRLVDIDRVTTGVPDFDWEELITGTFRARASAPVALSLQLAQVLLGTPVPPGLIDRLGASRFARFNLALLDPIRLAPRRAAFDHLLVLWCLPERAARYRLLRTIGSGQPNWFVNLVHEVRTAGGHPPDWFAAMLHANSGPGPAASGPLTLLKLLIFQLWVYCSAAAAWLTRSPRARRFRLWHNA